MQEMFEVAFWVVAVSGVLGIGLLICGIFDIRKDKKMQHLSGMADGVVCGLVKSHLFRNETHGNVPGGVLIGWGTAQGEQYWGGMLKMRIPPWFPCVTYEVDGKEVCKIMGEGVKKDTWKIGQDVTILYDPKNPQRSAIEGDMSLRVKAKLDFIVGTCLIAFCAVAVGLFLC